LKAYGIFEGGGVKGVALAGAYKAALDNPIEFIGFGGTSAGAIVATLASLNISADEIERVFVDQSFSSFFEDDGSRIRDAKASFSSNLNTILNATKRNILQVNIALYNLSKQYKKYTNYGISDGSVLKEKLIDVIKIKHPSFNENFTFTDLNELTKIDNFIKPLRILASDLNTERGIVFSFEKTPKFSVLDAVRASTSYPFIFQPLTGNFNEIGADVVLVDGGLSSNLPSFLFHEETLTTHYPIFAFDIVESKTLPKNVTSSVMAYIGSIVSTAMTASDNLLLSVTKGVYHIPVTVGDSVDTFDIDLSEEGRKLVFHEGYSSCNQSLSSNELIKLASCIDGKVHDEMELIYGSTALYTPILYRLKIETEILLNGASDCRTSLYIPTPNDSLMSLYYSGFSEAPKHNFDISSDKSVPTAFRERRYDWAIPDKEGERFVLSIPIGTKGDSEEEFDNVIAVLCIDCIINNVGEFDIFDDTGNISENVSHCFDVWIPILTELIGPNYLK